MEKSGKDGISESVSQRTDGTGIGADSRMAEIANRLRERIEVRSRTGGALSSALSRHVGRPIVESEVESYAKEHGLWIPIEITLRWRRLSEGHENEVFLLDDGFVYKINNLMHDGDVLALLERIQLHNRYFPNTVYELVGFTGFDNRSVFPVLRQAYVKGAQEMSPHEIDQYMARLGFCRVREATYVLDDVEVGDLRPRNVLKHNGIVYVIDAGFISHKSK